MIDAYKMVFGKYPAHYHISNCNCLEDGYHVGKELLQLNKRPTAIYANGDEVAGGIYLYANTIHLKIPDDLALIGQENQPIGIGLGITSVDHQLTKVGEHACNLIINKSNHKIKIPFHIIERYSV